MSQSITGHFNGKVIVPDKPVKLPVGTRLRIQVFVDKPKKTGKSNGKRLQIIGTGEYCSGIPDLGSNKKHLEGLGRK